MTVKEFYEYILSLGLENFTLVSEDWGNISERDIIINENEKYVSI